MGKVNFLQASMALKYWEALEYSKALPKVTEYPFKQNRGMLKNMTVLLYTYFLNISLNVLRPTFFNICNLSFLSSPNIGKIKIKVGPKGNYFSYFRSSCTNRIAVSITFFTDM